MIERPSIRWGLTLVTVAAFGSVACVQLSPVGTPLQGVTQPSTRAAGGDGQPPAVSSNTTSPTGASVAAVPSFQTIVPRVGPIVETLTIPGRIGLESEATLYFSIGGRLENVPVSVGQTVSQGQTLAELSTKDLSKDL